MVRKLRPFSRHYHVFAAFAFNGVVLLFAIFTTSCQTSRYREFESVHSGMTKGEVLQAVGGPNRTQRWHGRDRWEYTLYGHPEGDLIREVHFENGKSTYVGPAIKPPIPADEQDRINDEKNRQALIRESEQSSEHGFKYQRFEEVSDTETPVSLEQKPSTGK